MKYLRNYFLYRTLQIFIDFNINLVNDSVKIFVLLLKFFEIDSFLISACNPYFLSSYGTQKHQVTVTSGAAVFLNFTLKRVDMPHWSKVSDFNLARNLETNYLKPTEILSELGRFRDENPSISHFSVIGETAKKQSIGVLEISEGLEQGKGVEWRVRVLFVGGLSGSAPVGSEILIRFVRHLLAGEKPSIFFYM